MLIEMLFTNSLLRNRAMLVGGCLFLMGCGEPKTITMDRMHTVGGSGQYDVSAEVVDVGNGIVQYKEGETAWTNIRLKDETGQYTFHFLPAQHARQPVAGDKVKARIRGKMVDKTWGGSPTVQIIESFEFDSSPAKTN